MLARYQASFLPSIFLKQPCWLPHLRFLSNQSKPKVWMEGSCTKLYTRTHLHFPTALPTYTPTYLHIYTATPSTQLHTYPPTSLRTYLPTYILTQPNLPTQHTHTKNTDLLQDVDCGHKCLCSLHTPCTLGMRACQSQASLHGVQLARPPKLVCPVRRKATAQGEMHRIIKVTQAPGVFATISWQLHMGDLDLGIHPLTIDFHYQFGVFS